MSNTAEVERESCISGCWNRWGRDAQHHGGVGGRGGAAEGGGGAEAAPPHGCRALQGEVPGVSAPP